MQEHMTFSIRIPRHMYDRLVCRAQQEHRTRNSLVVHLLAPSLAQERAQDAKQSLDSESGDSPERGHADLHTWAEVGGR
jgi:hypothetical protein